MKRTFRKQLNQDIYQKLLLKDAKLSDITKHMLKKFWQSDNKFVVGFWLELIVIIIMVVKK